MVKPLTVQGGNANCGHKTTGNGTVFIGGAGISRTGIDSAAGVIIGPGSQSVYVEGSRVSLLGDAVAGHGKNLHAAPFIANAGQGSVFAGTGFVGDDAGGDDPRPDLITESFSASLTSVHTHDSQAVWGTPLQYYPPTLADSFAYICNCWTLPTGCPGGGPDWTPPPPVTLTYTVKNNSSQYTAQPFSVGFWKLPTEAEYGSLGTATEYNLVAGVEDADYSDYPDAAEFFKYTEMLGTDRFPNGLKPNQSYTGTFALPTLYLSEIQYRFAVYADVYQETTEPNENNSIALVTVDIDGSCLPDT